MTTMAQSFFGCVIWPVHFVKLIKIAICDFIILIEKKEEEEEEIDKIDKRINICGCSVQLLIHSTVEFPIGLRLASHKFNVSCGFWSKNLIKFNHLTLNVIWDKWMSEWMEYETCTLHISIMVKCLSDYTQLEIVEHFERQMKTRMHIM